MGRRGKFFACGLVRPGARRRGRFKRIPKCSFPTTHTLSVYVHGPLIHTFTTTHAHTFTRGPSPPARSPFPWKVPHGKARHRNAVRLQPLLHRLIKCQDTRGLPFRPVASNSGPVDQTVTLHVYTLYVHIHSTSPSMRSLPLVPPCGQSLHLSPLRGKAPPNPVCRSHLPLRASPVFC